MTCSLYWIHHPDHTDMFTQGYIGISNNVKRRFEGHRNRPANVHLKNAINKYGWDNLVKEIVLIADKAYCLMIELQLRATKQIGWNIAIGGGNPPDATGNKYRLGHTAWAKGKKLSEETRKKISEAVKLQMQNPVRREMNRTARLGLPSPMQGKQHTEESKRQMSLTKTGVPSKKKGIPLSLEQIQKMKEIAIKESWICPHCNKQGKAKGAGNRWHFDNCKEKDKQ